MTIISKDISKAVAILKKESLVAIPTETVYGLAGNIYSENAIKSIYMEMSQLNILILYIRFLIRLFYLIRFADNKVFLALNYGQLCIFKRDISKIEAYDLIVKIIFVIRWSLGFRFTNNSID